MFDKLRKLISGQVAELKDITAGPPDAKNVPDVGRVGFGELDRSMLGAYLGREVLSIEPMGDMGPQATSLLGQKFQDKLRQAGAGGAGLDPGELLPGMAAAREERLRAEGMSDEQIQMIRHQLAQASAAHRANGWDVELSHDQRATVQVVPIDSEEGTWPWSARPVSAPTSWPPWPPAPSAAASIRSEPGRQLESHGSAARIARIRSTLRG